MRTLAAFSRAETCMNARSIESMILPQNRDALRKHVEKQLLDDIPLAREMQLGISAWDGESLRMSAPLAPNVNDKGCAFGGSLVSMMTLACWSLITLAAEQAGEPCDIYVQDSAVRYLQPVWGDFDAEARLALNQSWASFFTTLHARGKARLSTHCEIRLPDGSVACALDARFVAFRRSATAEGANAAQSDVACQS